MYIAKSFGAEVTGVCSTRNVDMVRSIGGDHVIDYTQTDFAKLGRRYDLSFDCVGNHSLSECKRAKPYGKMHHGRGLNRSGMIGLLARLVSAFVLSQFGHQKLVTFLARPNKTDLAIMHNFMKAGKVKPVIDKRHSLSEVPQAIRYLAEKHARGKVVITLEDSDKT